MASSKLLDEIRNVLRVKNYSYRTEKTYIHWINKFILFHNKKHPLQMGEIEISQYELSCYQPEGFRFHSKSSSLCFALFV